MRKGDADMEHGAFAALRQLCETVPVDANHADLREICYRAGLDCVDMQAIHQGRMLAVLSRKAFWVVRLLEDPHGNCLTVRDYSRMPDYDDAASSQRHFLAQAVAWGREAEPDDSWYGEIIANGRAVLLGGEADAELSWHVARLENCVVTNVMQLPGKLVLRHHDCLAAIAMLTVATAEVGMISDRLKALGATDIETTELYNPPRADVRQTICFVWQNCRYQAVLHNRELVAIHRAI